MPTTSRTMPDTDWSEETVLVTGASGFIASALCDALAKSGAVVHGVSRSRPLSESIHWYCGDVTDLQTAKSVFAELKPDVTFHLASDSRASRDLELVPITFEANLVSAVNVMTAAVEAGCARVVLAGSQEELTAGHVPSSPYAAAKYAATLYARMFHALYELPVVVVRIFMVYGPGQKAFKLIPSVIETLLRGEAPVIDDGAREVDWVFVQDVVDALLLAGVKQGVEGAAIEVGSGNLVSIREVVELLAARIDAAVKPVYRGVRRPMEQRLVANPDSALRALGWRAETPLDVGLERTIDWYRDRAA